MSGVNINTRIGTKVLFKISGYGSVENVLYLAYYRFTYCFVWVSDLD
jgi:hypothetical protein